MEQIIIEDISIACYEGKTERVEFAIDNDLVNIHAKQDIFFRFAVKGGRKDLAVWLIDRGADVNAVDGQAICSATEHDYYDIVSIILPLSNGRGVGRSLCIAKASGYNGIAELIRNWRKNLENKHGTISR